MLRPTQDDSLWFAPPSPGPEVYQGCLIAEERWFILWGLKERWSSARICRPLGVTIAATPGDPRTGFL